MHICVPDDRVSGHGITISSLFPVALCYDDRGFEGTWVASLGVSVEDGDDLLIVLNPIRVASSVGTASGGELVEDGNGGLMRRTKNATVDGEEFLVDGNHLKKNQHALPEDLHS